MSISQNVRPCVRVSVHFEVLFKRIFAPTSRSQMSKVFRDFESLGKSNGKKWYQIYKPLIIMGVKSPGAKKLFLGKSCLTERDLFCIGVSHSF